MRLRTGAVAVLLIGAMALFGLLVYRGLGHFKSLGAGAATAQATRPEDTQAAFSLQGTIYLAQAGDLYALRDAHFNRLLAHDADHGDWMQPALTPDGSGLVVVGRRAASSDLYLVDLQGHILRRLTDNAAPRLPDGSLENNHWSFHPQVGGGVLWYTYDSPKGGYLVDFSVWSVPFSPAAPSAPPRAGVRPAGGIAGARRMTTPLDYTGGDVDPVPLAGGGLLFVRYSVDAQEHIRGQVVIDRTPPRGTGTALTDLAEDCGQPALSGNGSHIAMVCTQGQQTAQLMVRTLTGTAVGPPVVLASSVLGANPVWSPDGHSVIYLAPAATGGQFQLWLIEGADLAAPGSPREVTLGLGLDATSAPLWGAA